MADNLNVTTNDGATVVAADEIAGVKTQRVKIQHGADGAATDVSSASPLPVRLRNDAGEIVTTSARGSSNDKIALDVASTSALANITVSAGSGTRYFGLTMTPGTANVIADGVTGTVDSLNYVWWTGAFTAVGSGAGSMELQVSDDGVNWKPPPMEYSSNGAIPTISTGSVLHITATLTHTYNGPLKFRFMRIKTTGTVTGTYNFQIALTPTAMVKEVMPVLGAITSQDGWSNPANGIASASMQYGYVGGVLQGWDRIRVSNIVKTANATAVGSTAVWTPTSGRKFRLMRYKVDVTNSATLASPADLDLVFYDGATIMPIAETCTVPSAAVGGLGTWSTGWVDLGNGILSSTANNVLNINLSAALTAGKARILACGVEE